MARLSDMVRAGESALDSERHPQRPIPEVTQTPEGASTPPDAENTDSSGGLFTGLPRTEQPDLPQMKDFPILSQIHSEVETLASVVDQINQITNYIQAVSGGEPVRAMPSPPRETAPQESAPARSPVLTPPPEAGVAQPPTVQPEAPAAPAAPLPEQMNSILRTYNRLKKRSRSTIENFQEKTQMVLGSFGIEVHFREERSTSFAEEGAERRGSVRNLIVRAVLWGLIGLLILLGLLWQTGLIGTVGAARKGPHHALTKPSEIVAPAPAVEVSDVLATLPPETQAAASSEHRATGVAASAVSPPVAPPKHRLDSSPFGVHVASYRTQGSANREARKLRRKGFKTIIKAIDLPEKGRYYRVVLGPLLSRVQADSVRRLGQALLPLTYTRIVRVP